MPRTFRDLAILSHDSSLFPTTYLLHRSLWISLIFLLVLPLCFLRSITPLRFAGLVTSLSVAYFILLILLLYLFPTLGACLLYPSSSSSCAENTQAFPPTHLFLPHLLLACPIFFFSFSINFQVLPIYNALTHPSTSTASHATAWALLFSGGTSSHLPTHPHAKLPPTSYSPTHPPTQTNKVPISSFLSPPTSHSATASSPTSS